MIVKIKINGKEKKIGNLDTEKKTFLKTVSKSKHLFRAFDAWGLDYTFFDDVLYPENYTIHIYDKEEKRHYIATAMFWFKYGKIMNFPGSGVQTFLPRGMFDGAVDKVEFDKKIVEKSTVLKLL